MTGVSRTRVEEEGHVRRRWKQSAAKLTALGFGLTVGVASTAAFGQDLAIVERGQAQFKEQGCYGCHTVGKFGTPIGPDLSHIGARHDQGHFTRWLRDPESVRPAHMPRLELTETQIAALAAYLSSLR